ncbi:TetR/AcrR family transcriptional regulator [Streptomyces sp. NPDC126503]|uniref:TetR/AcrR family transcriptional regulator n=1 Tax=Streptomyces sp. NPDC126503 TaxID=3155315 RepID=UPI003323333E
MAKQERAVRTREALLRSAAEIFDTDGFVSASLSAICSKAGVSSGALHFHFASKGALAEAIERAAEARLRLITGPDLDPDDDLDAADGTYAGDDLDAAGRTRTADGTRPGDGTEAGRTRAAGRPVSPVPADRTDGADRPDPVRLIVATSHRLFDQLNTDVVLRAGFTLGCEPSWQSRADLHGQWRDWIASALRLAARRGALADGTDPEDAVTVVAASTVGFEALGRKDPAWLSQERLSQFWQFMLPRLVPPGTGPQKGT